MASQSAKFWSNYSSIPMIPQDQNHRKQQSAYDAQRRGFNSDPILAGRPRPCKPSLNRSDSVDNVLAVVRSSLRQTQRAVKSLTIDKPHTRYDNDKLKWISVICKETNASFARISKTRAEQDQFCTPTRADAELDLLLEDFGRLYVSLFSRVTCATLGAEVIDELARVFISTSCLQTGKRETIWLQGLQKVTDLMLQLDPAHSLHLYQTFLEDLRHNQRFPRYHIYVHLFRVVLQLYDTKLGRTGESSEWEFLSDTITTYAGESMIDDFRSLSKSLTPRLDNRLTANACPEQLIQRLSVASRIAKGHMFLSRAHEARGNLSDELKRASNHTNDKLMREFQRVVELYKEAQELLMDSDKDSSGLALTILGRLHWNFPIGRNGSLAYVYFQSAVCLEDVVQATSWWLGEAKRSLVEYEEHLRVLKEEAMRKEEEEQRKRKQEEEQCLRQAEQARLQEMLDNLDDLKSKGSRITSVQDMVEFFGWIYREYPPPGDSPRVQLRQYGEQFKNQEHARRLCVKKIIRLFHPDKNGKQGDRWREICAEITKVSGSKPFSS